VNSLVLLPGQFALASLLVNSIKLPERMLALLIMSNSMPVLRRTDFTVDRAQFLYALLKNHRIDLASCIIDLIAFTKLSKSKKFALPYGSTISKILIHFSLFPCSSDHIAPRLGPCDQTNVAKSESLKRKRQLLLIILLCLPLLSKISLFLESISLIFSRIEIYFIIYIN
jgi:hypothetical protein